MPVAAAVVLSLTAWNGISWDTATFVGLDNYVEHSMTPGSGPRFGTT